MEYLYALLGGISAKLYDDLYDNNMISPLVQEVLKGSQWMLLTLLSYSDFTFTLLNYLMNLGNSISDKDAFKSPYEKSLLILYPVLFFISYHTMTKLSIYDSLFILYGIAVLSIEPRIFTEDYSYRKLFARLSSILFNILGFYIGLHFKVSNGILKTFIYGLGYVIVSSCFQAYLLYTQKADKEDMKEQEVIPVTTNDVPPQPEAVVEAEETKVPQTA
jgi:hypothetical protein